MEMKRIKGNNNRAVKLHHPDYRRCMLAIEDPGIIYKAPYPCPHCKITHEYKTYHLILDEHGDTSVTQVMYDFLNERRLLRDLKATTEIEPTPQSISVGTPFTTSENVLSNERGVIRIGMNGHA